MTMELVNLDDTNWATTLPVKEKKKIPWFKHFKQTTQLKVDPLILSSWEY